MGEVLRVSTIKALKTERDLAQSEARASRTEAKRALEESERLSKERSAAEGRSIQLLKELRSVEDALEVCRLDLEAAELEREEAQDLLEIEKKKKTGANVNLVFGHDQYFRSEETLVKALVALREIGAVETKGWRLRCEAAEAAGSGLAALVKVLEIKKAESQEKTEQANDNAYSEALIEKLTLDKVRLEERLDRVSLLASEAQVMTETRDELEEVYEAEIKDLNIELSRWQQKYLEAHQRADRIQSLSQQIDQASTDLLSLAKQSTEAKIEADRRADIAEAQTVATQRAWDLEQRRYTKALRAAAAPGAGFEAMLTSTFESIPSTALEFSALENAVHDIRAVLDLSALLRSGNTKITEAPVLHLSQRFGFPDCIAKQALLLLTCIAAADSIEADQGPETVRPLRQAMATHLWLDTELDASSLHSALDAARHEPLPESLPLIQDTSLLLSTALNPPSVQDLTRHIEKNMSTTYQRCHAAELIVLVARLAAVGEVSALLAPRHYRGDHLRLTEARNQSQRVTQIEAEQRAIAIDAAKAAAASADARRLAAAAARDDAAFAESEARQREAALTMRLHELEETKTKLQNELSEANILSARHEADASSLRSALEARDHSVAFSNPDKKRRSSSSSSKLDALRHQQAYLSLPTTDALAEAALKALLPPLPPLARANRPLSVFADTARTPLSSFDNTKEDTLQNLLSELRGLRTNLVQNLHRNDSAALAQRRHFAAQLSDLRHRTEEYSKE